MAGGAATAVSSCPILHSWRWGAQYPVAPTGISLGMGTPDMDTLCLLSTHGSDTDPLVHAFPLPGCSYHTKGATMRFFPCAPLALNSYSSDFCAICNCVFSQPAVCASSISLMNSSQPFHVTRSPWNTFYQNPLWAGNSPLTLCDPFRPINSADDFLATVF